MTTLRGMKLQMLTRTFSKHISEQNVDLSCAC